MRQSLYSTSKSKNKGKIRHSFASPQKLNGYIKLGGGMTNGISSNQELRSMNSPLQSPSKGNYGRIYGQDIERTGTANTVARQNRFGGTVNMSTGFRQVSRQGSLLSEEYGCEEVDNLERISRFDFNEVESDDERETILAIRRSVVGRKGQIVKGQTEEPVDHYVEKIKGSLCDYKTGLAQETNIENMVACVTAKYMQKFAADDTKNKVD